MVCEVVMRWEHMFSRAGDINNDGYDDIMIGAPKADPDFNRNQAGQIYMIFGQQNWTSPLSVAQLNGVNGFMINGATTNDKAGTSSDGGIDLNHDNIEDFIVGAPYATLNGSVYAIWGQTSPWPVNVELSNVNGSISGIIVTGNTMDSLAGTSLWGIYGNDNDILIGAPGFSSVGSVANGQAFLAFRPSQSPPIPPDNGGGKKNNVLSLGTIIGISAVGGSVAFCFVILLFHTKRKLDHQEQRLNAEYESLQDASEVRD